MNHTSILDSREANRQARRDIAKVTGLPMTKAPKAPKEMPPPVLESDPRYRPYTDLKAPTRPVSTMEFFTPSKARAELIAHGRKSENGQRPLSEARVRATMREIDEHRYVEVAPDIGAAYDWDGNLLNHHHTLEAIARGRYGLWVHVSRGWDPADFKLIDVGNKRTVAQALFDLKQEIAPTMTNAAWNLATHAANAVEVASTSLYKAAVPIYMEDKYFSETAPLKDGLLEMSSMFINSKVPLKAVVTGMLGLGYTLYKTEARDFALDLIARFGGVSGTTIDETFTLFKFLNRDKVVKLSSGRQKTTQGKNGVDKTLEFGDAVCKVFTSYVARVKGRKYVAGSSRGGKALQRIRKTKGEGGASLKALLDQTKGTAQ